MRTPPSYRIGFPQAPRRRFSAAEARRARERLDATLDVFAEPNGAEADDEAVLRRLWTTLRDVMADANGEVNQLNAVLGETLDHLTLTPERDGLAIQPVLSLAAAGRATIEVATRNQLIESTVIPLLVAAPR